MVISLFLWVFNAHFSQDIQSILMGCGVLIVVLFAIGPAIGRIRSPGRKEPAEYEIFRKIFNKNNKASFIPFYVSIYFRLSLIYFSDWLSIGTSNLIGAGIPAMVVIFFFMDSHKDFRDEK